MGWIEDREGLTSSMVEVSSRQDIHTVTGNGRKNRAKLGGGKRERIQRVWVSARDHSKRLKETNVSQSSPWICNRHWMPTVCREQNWTPGVTSTGDTSVAKPQLLKEKVPWHKGVTKEALLLGHSGEDVNSQWQTRQRRLHRKDDTKVLSRAETKVPKEEIKDS